MARVSSTKAVAAPLKRAPPAALPAGAPAPPEKAIAAPLLAWFARARRDLPWRAEPRDPYRVWISEVMLQQTRVDVVVPYFERFTRRFPTLRALAEAELDQVLALWSGLGYYSRARNLHRAARAAAEASAPREPALPRTSAELGELPGFGPYTAAAVASLAFGEDVPLVDGNVARVLARLFRLEGDARAQSWPIATALLPDGSGGAFNEALMELGALVCTPRSPRCLVCPLQRLCDGRSEPERYPARKARKERPQLEWRAVALTRKDGAVLLSRRPEGALFGGLWDLPAPEAVPGLAAALQPRGEVRQTLTHREITVLLESGSASGRAPPGMRWVGTGELAAFGLSSLTVKCLRKAGIELPRAKPAAR
jgi:A/G-specific adenine glycosylase